MPGLVQELLAATKAKEESTAAKMRTAMEAQKEKGELVARTSALVEKSAELTHEIRLQRLAAKALGMLYLQRLGSLKGQLRRTSERSDLMERELQVSTALGPHPGGTETCSGPSDWVFSDWTSSDWTLPDWISFDWTLPDWTFSDWTLPNWTSSDWT